MFMLQGNRWPTAFLASALVLSFAFCLTGCGGSVDGRYPVSGVVTLDGEPLNQGSIEFSPTNATVTTRSGSIIRNGSFQVPVEHGLQPGEYKVVITSSTGGGTDVEEDFPGDSSAVEVAQEVIPARYNTESYLTAVVEAGDKNAFEFFLDSK